MEADLPTGADYAAAAASRASGDVSYLATRLKNLETVTINGEEYVTVEVVKAVGKAMFTLTEEVNRLIQEVQELQKHTGLEK